MDDNAIMSLARGDLAAGSGALEDDPPGLIGAHRLLSMGLSQVVLRVPVEAQKQQGRWIIAADRADGPGRSVPSVLSRGATRTREVGHG